MKKQIVTILLFSFTLINCATIMHGPNQEVGLSSSPTGAIVKIDNQQVGNTPLTYKMERKGSHIISFEMEGYQPYQTTITSKLSGWVWGNIVLGGLIGLGIDAITGSLYQLTPEQIHAQITKNEISLFENGESGLFVTVVLEADPEWKLIGQMEKI